jgi:Skp family chaperone for outer membrane proteins
MMVASVAVMALLVGGSSLAPAATEPPPVGIRVLDVFTLFNNLQARKDGDAELKTLNNKLEDQRKAKEDDLRKMLDNIDKSFKPDTPEYKEETEKMLMARTDLEAFTQYIELKIKLEKRLRTAKLFMEINKAIEEYSKANGIGLVFATDDPDLSKAANEQDLVSRITTRKVLYAHSSLDITQAIQDKMNTEYRVPAPR